MTPITREQWLTDFAHKHLWKLIGAPAKVRISIGFPSKSALARRKRRVGECWSNTCSGDKTFEIFVSPFLSVFDATHTLLHELIHAFVGLECGHKGAFKRAALKAGLKGKMTATVPGKELTATLRKAIESSPEFPGAPMQYDPKQKKQGTRLIKVVCTECGYTCRVTRKWIDEVGAPRCPAHDGMEIA